MVRLIDAATAARVLVLIPTQSLIPGATYQIRVSRKPPPTTAPIVNQFPLALIITGQQPGAAEADFRCTQLSRFAGEIYSLSWRAAPGFYYRLGHSTDLVQWSHLNFRRVAASGNAWLPTSEALGDLTVSQNTADARVNFHYAMPQGFQQPTARYFRVRLVPAP